jgi:hypothetical protein
MKQSTYYAMIDEMVGTIDELLIKHGAFETSAAASDELQDVAEALDEIFDSLLDGHSSPGNTKLTDAEELGYRMLANCDNDEDDNDGRPSQV